MTTKTLDRIDRDLHEIIDAVEHAANWGIAHKEQKDDADRTLNDCEELLHHVMDASVLDDE